MELLDQVLQSRWVCFVKTAALTGTARSATLQNLPAVQQLEPRIAAAVERLNDMLRTALDAALRSREQASMLLCLRAYAAIGNPAGAEEVGMQALHHYIMSD